MSDRISSSPGLPGIGLPEPTTGPAAPTRPGPSTLQGPADDSLRKRKRKGEPADEPAPARRRVSVDALRTLGRPALSGLTREAGAASLLVAQQALLDPDSPTTAQVSRQVWSGGTQGHKTGAKTLGTSATAADPAGATSPAAAPPNLAHIAHTAFKQHAVEPAAGKTREADVGKWRESATTHSRSQGHTGAWARSVETVGIQALGRQGLGLSTAGFGEVGVGARGQTQFVKQHRLGEVVAQGGGEVSLSAQGSGALNANATGLNVQAGGQVRGGLRAESSVALRTREADIKLAGVHLDLTPNLDAKGRTSLGGEGGGSMFAGVSVPTAQERAAGTSFKAGLEAAGSAFAGAKAEGDISVGVGGNKIGLTGGLSAGAGAEGKASGSLSKVNGRTTARVELKAGAALGLGASLGIAAQVDVQPVVDAAKKVLKLGDAVVRRLA